MRTVANPLIRNIRNFEFDLNQNNLKNSSDDAARQRSRRENSVYNLREEKRFKKKKELRV